MTNYSLFQDGIFRLLREGNGFEDPQEYFYNAINEHIRLLAKGCNSTVKISPTRLWEVQDLWELDLKALISESKLETSSYPCEYKHAAFLCYWLRRRVIVESCRPINTSLGIVDENFRDYKNEYVAFFTGLNLVLYHHFFSKIIEKKRAEEILKGYRFPNDLAREALVLLHHKNVSPHSIYLFFKALTTQLPPPPILDGKPVRLVSSQ